MQASRVGSGELELRDGTVKAALQDDVDDARDRVGAIGCRCAIREDVDAVHGERGNDRRIDTADTIGLRRMAHAVHHHDRARPGGIKAAYVDAGQSLELARRIGGKRARRDVRDRNGAEQIRGGGGACRAEILGAQICHRHADSGGAVNERAGDQHLLGHFARRSLGHLCLSDLLGLRRERARHRQQGSRSHQDGEFGCCRIHVSLPGARTGTRLLWPEFSELLVRLGHKAGFYIFLTRLYW